MKNIATIIAKSICPVFAGCVGYAIIFMLKEGRTSVCRGPTPKALCRFVIADNPQFYWLSMFVWFLIFGILIYGSIKGLKAKI